MYCSLLDLHNDMLKTAFLTSVGASTGSTTMLLVSSLPSLSEHTDVLVFIAVCAVGATVYFFKKWMSDREAEIKELQKFRERLILRLVKQIDIEQLDEEEEGTKSVK